MRAMKAPVYQMRPDERLVAGLVYLGGLLPIWGILIAWVVREAWRERSRHVVFHTTQCIWFHASLLLAFIVFSVIHLACRILLEIEGPEGSGAEPALVARLLSGAQRVNEWMMLALSAGFVVTTLVVAWRVMDGRSVSLPFLGSRVGRQIFGGR